MKTLRFFTILILLTFFGIYHSQAQVFPRKVEQLESDYVEIRTSQLAEAAEGVYINFAALRNDFPLLRSLNDEQIQSWLEENFNFVSSYNRALNNIGNSAVGSNKSAFRTFKRDEQKLGLQAESEIYNLERMTVTEAKLGNALVGLIEIEGLGHHRLQEAKWEVLGIQERLFFAGDPNDTGKRNFGEYKSWLLSINQAVAKLLQAEYVSQSPNLALAPGQDPQVYAILKLPLKMLNDGKPGETATLVLRRPHWGRISDYAVTSEKMPRSKNWLTLASPIAKDLNSGTKVLLLEELARLRGRSLDDFPVPWAHRLTAQDKQKIEDIEFYGNSLVKLFESQPENIKVLAEALSSYLAYADGIDQLIYALYCMMRIPPTEYEFVFQHLQRTIGISAVRSLQSLIKSVNIPVKLLLIPELNLPAAKKRVAGINLLNVILQADQDTRRAVADKLIEILLSPDERSEVKIETAKQLFSTFLEDGDTYIHAASQRAVDKLAANIPMIADDESRQKLFVGLTLSLESKPRNSLSNSMEKLFVWGLQQDGYGYWSKTSSIVESRPELLLDDNIYGKFLNLLRRQTFVKLGGIVGEILGQNDVSKWPLELQNRLIKLIKEVPNENYLENSILKLGVNILKWVQDFNFDHIRYLSDRKSAPASHINRVLEIVRKSELTDKSLISQRKTFFASFIDNEYYSVSVAGLVSLVSAWDAQDISPGNMEGLQVWIEQLFKKYFAIDEDMRHMEAHPDLVLSTVIHQLESKGEPFEAHRPIISRLRSISAQFRNLQQEFISPRPDRLSEILGTCENALGDL